MNVHIGLTGNPRAAGTSIHGGGQGISPSTHM